MGDQLKLVPEEVQLPPVQQVLLADIEPDARLAGDEAPAKLIRSIERFGVLFPVILVKCAEGYSVYDGRSRVKACRQLDLETVPARVYEDGFVNPNVLTLAANALRRPNPQSDLIAISSLLEEGASEREIVEATGLSTGTLRSRLRLMQLPPYLFEAFLGGEISSNLGQEIVRLPASARDRLDDIYAESGQVTREDIRSAKTGARAQALDALPSDLFTGPELATRPIRAVEAGAAADGARVYLQLKMTDGILTDFEVDAGDLYRALIAYGLIQRGERRQAA